MGSESVADKDLWGLRCISNFIAKTNLYEKSQSDRNEP